MPGEQGTTEKFICLEDLLDGFTKPKIMDVKLGFRTFQESECKCGKPRPDLFKRTLEMFPEHISAEEQEAKAITKHRFMTLRDATSTTASLGFRTDGWAGCEKVSREDMKRQLSEVASADDVAQIFSDFAQMAATDEGQHVGAVCPQRLAEDIVEQLQHMRQSLSTSHFVQRHEFIGTSVLIIADAYGRIRVAWIDFAKTQLIPEGMELTHMNVWKPGNHEDGLLAGLDGLVHVWNMASRLASFDEGQLGCSSLRAGALFSSQPVEDGATQSLQLRTRPRGFSPQSWLWFFTGTARL